MHVSNSYKTKTMCKKAVDTCPFMSGCVPNCNKTQEMCKGAVVACLPSLKFVTDWFVTNKMQCFL